MKYQMPEPEGVLKGYVIYNERQMREAFSAGRAAGLEAAAKVVEIVAHRLGGSQFAADVIRNLKETP